MSWCRLDTHACKIFIFTVCFKCHCQGASQMLIKNIELSCNQVLLEWHCQKTKKKTKKKQRQKLFSSSCSLMTSFLNKKIKMKTWYAHIIQKTPLLNTREPHFSLVWVMEFSISSCLSKVKIFPIILTW